MRRITAALAAGLIAVTGFAGTATPAKAQTLELVRLLNGNIATANCDSLRTGLTATRMVNKDTTRSQLVMNLNTAVGNDAALRLVSASTVGAVADRALECGIVKPDPVTPLDQLFAGSSQMSSQAGLPDIRTLIPALPTIR